MTTTDARSSSTSIRSTNGRGGRERQPYTETRPSIRTSEFIVFLVTSLLMIIVAYTDEAFNVEHGMTLVAVISVGYMLSRGIAKAGSREPYAPERS